MVTCFRWFMRVINNTMDNQKKAMEELVKLSKEELSQAYFTWKNFNDPLMWEDTFANANFSSYQIYPYFASSNLSAWKLKYCLDNDTIRFT